VLQETAARQLSRQVVRAMLHRFGLSAVKEKPPAMETESQQMVQTFLQLAQPDAEAAHPPVSDEEEQADQEEQE